MLTLHVAAKEPVADAVVAVTLQAPDGSELPAWEPGAHVDLELGDLVRQYSLCGSPADRASYRVAVLREPDGRGGSAFVHDRLDVGDEVPVRGPRNHFALRPASRYLFVAGGIGITPLLPMIAAASAVGVDWRLVYGGRTRESMAFRDELATAHPDRISLYPQDETGLLDLTALVPAPGTLVYCCGPAPLLDAMEKRAVDWAEGTLRVERFTAAGSAPGPAGEFEVELAGSGRVLVVPPDRSVLQALEDGGAPVLSSCREGTCGTCETAVLDGVVDHRDALLTPAERAANDTMFVCVSRATSARLVLDL